MFVNQERIKIQWGDCDPADIVFYPNYLAWFDNCTTALFQSAGFPLPDLFKFHKVIGIPVVDVHVQFFAPSRFGDELRVESEVTEFRKSSFTIRHRFFQGDVLAVEGFETRVWTGPDPQIPGRMKSRPIPADLIARLSKPRAAE